MATTVVRWPCRVLGRQRGAARSRLAELRDIGPMLPFLELAFEHPASFSFQAEEERVIEMPGHAGLTLSSVLVGRGGRADDTLVLLTFFDLAPLKEFRGAAGDPGGFVLKAVEAQRDSPYLGLVGPASRPATRSRAPDRLGDGVQLGP